MIKIINEQINLGIILVDMKSAAVAFYRITTQFTAQLGTV